MKKRVRCINPFGTLTDLTLGKVYEVIKENSSTYTITGNHKVVEAFKYRFEEVKSEKPKTFAIIGKPNLIKAIWEDLKELGYGLVDTVDLKKVDWKGIGPGWISDEISTRDIQNYKTLYLSTGNSKVSNDESTIFNLPQDYQKALDYAKEALNPENWEEQDQIKIGQYPAQFIGNTVTFGCKTNITLEEAQALKTVYNLSERIGPINFESDDSFTIEGNEIPVSILDKVIKKLKDG